MEALVNITTAHYPGHPASAPCGNLLQTEWSRADSTWLGN